LEIAKELSENPNVTVVYDIEYLEESLKTDFSFVEESSGNRLVRSLKNYIFSIS
jgi:beta-1,4-N-acetylglucosaminyltransferase